MTRFMTSKTRTRRTSRGCAVLKGPHAIHPVYMRASRHSKVVELLTDLWGSLRFDTGKLNMKSAGYGAPIEWHQDWAFYPHTNEDLAAGRHHDRRCRYGERSDDGRAGQPQGADLRPSCPG